MKKIYVDSFSLEDGIYMGVSIKTETSKKNLQNIFGKQYFQKLMIDISEEPNSQHFIYNYCQFIIYFYKSTTKKIILQFIDSTNSDSYLDYLNMLKKANWPNNYITKASFAFKKIQNENKEFADIELIEN